MSARILAAGARAFPTAERLEARPCACGRALRTICVCDARFDLVEEPLGFFRRTVEASGQTIIHIIGDLHGFIHTGYFADGCDGQEHFMLPQAVREGQVNDEGAFAVIAFIEHTACLHVAADEELAAALIDFFTKILEIIVGRFVDNGAVVGVAVGGVTDDEFGSGFLQTADQVVVNRILYEYARSGGAFLSLQAEG